MTTFATAKDVFLDHFAQFDNHWDGAPFTRLRHEARQRFHDLSLPGTKTEDWRFTSLSSLLKLPLELAVEGAAPVLAPRAPAEGIRLVFVNGRFQADASLLGTLPKGVHVSNLAQAPKEVERHLGRIADYHDNVFTALNSGLLHDGALVLIGTGVVLEQAIEIVYHTTAAARSLAVQPRTLIVLERNSQATVVECYEGHGTYFTNAVTEVSLAADARLDHYKLQEESGAAYHIANTQIVQEQNSNFTSHYVSLGGRLVRNEVRIRFDGQHAEATVNGLYQGSGQQHLDNFTVIDHAMPNCASHELYKGILDDQAHGVFNGKIFVRPDAQKTDAKQTNKVLLLSENATINTKPQLEIFADDVKCTHGATIGQLDEDQIFYLRARGLGLSEARKLLTFAFANDIVGRIKIAAIRDRLEESLVRGTTGPGTIQRTPT